MNCEEIFLLLEKEVLEPGVSSFVICEDGKEEEKWSYAGHRQWVGDMYGHLYCAIVEPKWTAFKCTSSPDPFFSSRTFGICKYGNLSIHTVDRWRGRTVGSAHPDKDSPEYRKVCLKFQMIVRALTNIERPKQVTFCIDYFWDENPDTPSHSLEEHHEIRLLQDANKKN